MKRLFVFLILALFLFSGCSSSFSAMDNTEVKKVIFWTRQSEREATADEMASILELYNTSKYGGKATGEGGTPDFGARIILENDDEIIVNDFYGKVEVLTKNKAFYLETQKLYETLKKAASLPD